MLFQSTKPNYCNKCGRTGRYFRKLNRTAGYVLSMFLLSHWATIVWVKKKINVAEMCCRWLHVRVYQTYQQTCRHEDRFIRVYTGAMEQNLFLGVPYRLYFKLYHVTEEVEVLRLCLQLCDFSLTVKETAEKKASEWKGWTYVEGCAEILNVHRLQNVVTSHKLWVDEFMQVLCISGILGFCWVSPLCVLQS